MEMPKTQKYLDYHFGSLRQLTDDQLKALLTHLQTQPPPGTSVLGGRAAVITTDVDGLGPVAIKQFKRGGLIRFIIKNKYMKYGKTRGQIELELMHRLRQRGIRTPEPIAYAYRGFPLYAAWLITRKIKNACTLAEFCGQDTKRVNRIMISVLDQIDRLVECGCMHVDLHPGNILVDQNDHIYLIDFDKGYFSSANRQKLYDTYYKRWRRSIIKHRLPTILDEMFQNRRRQYVESSNSHHDA
jgi:3-deoxy-D-manno-octulosonic acid kinase